MEKLLGVAFCSTSKCKSVGLGRCPAESKRNEYLHHADEHGFTNTCATAFLKVSLQEFSTLHLKKQLHMWNNIFVSFCSWNTLVRGREPFYFPFKDYISLSVICCLRSQRQLQCRPQPKVNRSPQSVILSLCYLPPPVTSILFVYYLFFSLPPHFYLHEIRLKDTSSFAIGYLPHPHPLWNYKKPLIYRKAPSTLLPFAGE